MIEWRKLLAALILILGSRPGFADVIVFATVSTEGPVQEIISLYNAEGSGKAKASFASSSILAKQIVKGAPASIFISANPQWMDYLASAKAILPASRFDLVSNRLALIAKAGDALAIDIVPLFPLAALLGGGKLAMGDPDHVPAGIYAKAALENLGVFETVSSQVIRAFDARAALALVQRGEAAAGIVYASDAKHNKGVQLAGVFPASSHPPIIYQAAVVAGGDHPLTQNFLRLLKSSAAAFVFAKHGFVVINDQAR